jgi:PsbN protein
MESPAFFFTFFLWFLLLSVTGFSVYVSFGPPSKKLRDPFEEHEDSSVSGLILIFCIFCKRSFEWIL